MFQPDVTQQQSSPSSFVVLERCVWMIGTTDGLDVYMASQPASGVVAVACFAVLTARFTSENALLCECVRVRV